MMRKLMAVLIVLVASTAWAMSQRYAGTISVSQTNTTTNFTDNHSGGSGTQFAAKFVTISSSASSANTCYVDFDGTATTSDWAIEPGATLSVTFIQGGQSGGQDGFSSLGTICSSGQTATFYVKAGR